MHHLYLFSLILCLPFNLFAQDLYFPPNNTSEWDTIDPAALGWQVENIAPFLDYLEGENTKAFIVLKDGKIAIEKYFGTFQRDSNWVWFSAGKSLNALLIGIAQEEGLLSIEDKTSDYLGKGWTALPVEKEDLITIENQLSMTSGMDEDIFTCTIDTCLRYVADAGTRWSYHNGPYSLLRNVGEKACGMNWNQFTNTRLRIPTGMNGFWVASGFNNFYISTARSMARFGLLILNKGTWDNKPILSDQEYYNQMVNSSQALNPAYGYLWWLNGKSSYIPPNPTETFPGSIAPDAPEDMFAAAGAMGQFACIVPSQNLVLIRMGLENSSSNVPINFMNEMWRQFNMVLSNPTNTNEPTNNSIKLFPNPAQEMLNMSGLTKRITSVSLIDALGRIISLPLINNQVNVSQLTPGTYILEVQSGRKVIRKRFIKL